VREADDDIELAQHGIIYIDEIDKIAGSRHMIGADVSRAGVQRALLKPMEETEVDLKVPHDPVSMIQEIENFRKTGQKEKRTVNTANILFIMSGAFGELEEIVRQRVARQRIGFGAPLKESTSDPAMLRQVKSEDLIAFGFESEFVGRLPVRTVLEPLDENDLYTILRNPSNPIILGKKLDFNAYGIDVKFDDRALRQLATDASAENTGARGLVSAVERALLPYETRLPSTDLQQFPVTPDVVGSPAATLKTMLDPQNRTANQQEFKRLTEEEKEAVKSYIQENKRILSDRYNLTLTPSRLEVLANFHVNHILDIGQVFQQIKSRYDDIKKIELEFYKRNDINIVFEEDAIDFIMEQVVDKSVALDSVETQLNENFGLGLKLVMEKTGKNRFFIDRNALANPESFIGGLIRNGLKTPPLSTNERSESE